MDNRLPQKWDTRREQPVATSDIAAFFAAAIVGPERAKGVCASMTGPNHFSQTDLVGQTIGNYAIMERLGQGGMGVVYRALKLDDGKLGIPLPVALKYPTVELDKEARARFHREIEVLSFLSSPYLVGIKAVGCHDIDGEQRPYYAMDFVDCVTLQTLLRDLYAHEKSLNLDATLYIANEVLGALEYLHHCAMYKGEPLEVIHRDISPDNILIRRPQVSVVLTDFGVASAIQEHSSGTAIVGKPRYMPPEALEFDAERTTKMDIWSTAVVMWEMLHGKRFLGGLDHDMQVCNAILDHKLPSFDPSIPAPLVDLLERMLDGDPSERSSAPEARDELLSISIALGLNLQLGRKTLDGTLRELYGTRSTSGKSEAFMPVLRFPPPSSSPSAPPLPSPPPTARPAAPNPFDEDSPTLAFSSPASASDPTRPAPLAAPQKKNPPPRPPSRLVDRRVHKIITSDDRPTTSPRHAKVASTATQHPEVDPTKVLPPPPRKGSIVTTEVADSTPSNPAQTLPDLQSHPEDPIFPERDIRSLLPWATALLALTTVVFATLFFFS